MGRYYLAESYAAQMQVENTTYQGIKATYNGDLIYLYVIVTDDQREPLTWPPSHHGYGPITPRRSPRGTEDWWVVVNSAQGAWPGTTLSSRRTPLDDSERTELLSHGWSGKAIPVDTV